MAATRISVYTAERTARDMAAATYDPLDKAHVETGDALIEEILERIYGKQDLATYRGLPVVFRRSNDTLWLDGTGCHCYIEGGQKHTMPDRRVDLLRHQDLAEKATAWQEEKERLRQERRRVQSQILTAIKALRTVERVKVEFPDAVPFLPTAQVAATLPAIPVDDIVATLRNAKTPPK